MGFKDVFTAYAVADGKVVSGLGYTSYVDAYEENGKYIFGAGFVSLADKNHITQADVEKGVKIIVDESESDYYEYTEFKLTFNQNWGPLHYVAYKQYVHYQVADYIVQNSITPDNGQYIDAYGDVYDYDIGDTCHYVNYGGDFELNAYGLTSKVDYDNIVETYVQIIQEQTKNLVDVQVEKADFISVQALNDYLAHNQREEFLGIDADTILYYEANTADTQYYIIRENGEVEVLNLPPDPVKKASIFQRIATGIAAISGAVLGAVLCALPGAGPIVGGALLSASIDVFMQVTVCGTAPENIDWLSVATSAVVGGITGGMGMVSNAIVKNVAASGIKALLVKVGTQTLTGMFSGGVAYLLNATVRGEDVDFFDCMKSMCVGGLTGALTGLCSTALQSITTEANGLMVALQVISGGLSGGVSYMLSIAITGDEFSWQAFAMSVGMGAVTAAVTVVGEKIVKTVQVKKFERVEKAQKARNEQAKELGIIDDSPLTPQELAELKKTINKYITSDDNKNWKLVDKNGQPLTKNQLMDNPTQEAYLVSTDKSGYVDANGNKFKLPVVRGHVDQGALAVDNVYAKGGIYAKRQATFDMFDELLADKWSAPGAKVPDDFKAYFKSQPLINDDLSNLKWQDIAKARAGNALGYSWHEDPDLHTGYLIKTEMHTSIKHQGGHSIINNLIKSQDISKTRTDLYNEIIAQHKGGK
ncbi:MAG: hypothetical protein K2G38_06505 [Clostridia bacterium]|nr:hypothetical protein [Clostridia bacterium]